MKRFFLLFILIFMFPAQVAADELNMSLNPQLTLVTASPSSSNTVDLELTNNGDTDLVLVPEIVEIDPTKNYPFKKLSEIVSPLFSFTKNDEVIADSFPLRSDEKAKISLSTTFPPSFAGKDMYITLILKTQPKGIEIDKKTSDIRATTLIQAGIGTNIFYSIYSQSESFNSFSLLLKDFSAPPFMTSESYMPTAIITNKSNHLTQVIPSVSIYDISGRIVKTTRLDKTILFAGQDRKLYFDSVSLNKDFGKYRAQIKIETLNGQVLLDEKDFYVIPKTTIEVLFIATALLLFIAIRVVNFIRKKKKTKK